MIAGLKRLVISVSVLTLIFKVGLGLSWTDTLWAITLCGFFLFILQAIFDLGRDVAQAFSREQHNYNFIQNVEQKPAEPLHPDFSRPDSAREAYPAVITVRRERKRNG